MPSPRPSLLASLFAALLLATLPLPALGLGDFLGRFKELRAPAALDPPGFYARAAGSISIEDFEALVMVPAHSLAPSRPGLRSLDEWSVHIIKTRAFQTHPVLEEDYSMAILPLGRWSLGGYTIAALEVSALHSFVDGGRSWSSSYLLSFSPSGKLVDGLRFAASSDHPPPIASGGRPRLEGATLSLDPRGPILAFDSYGLRREYNEYVAGEVWSWEIELNPDGSFRESPRRDLFLLSRVYAEAGENPSRLFLYEGEGGASGEPTYLAWQDAVSGLTLWARAETGSSRGGATGSDRSSLKALDPSGNPLSLDFSQNGKKLSLLDTLGRNRVLDLEYGSGLAGEATKMKGLSLLGDKYDPRSLTWTYLFTEASLPSLPEGEKLLFAARSFVEGTVAAERGGSPNDLIGLGSLDEARVFGLGYAKATFAPRSLFNFETGLIESGLLAGELSLGGESPLTLPVGTKIEAARREGIDPPDHWVAILPKETAIKLLGQDLGAPAQSRITLELGTSASAASFPLPLGIRLGSSTARISGFDFSEGRSFSLASPFTITMAGAKLTFMDSLVLDSQGRVEGGRLAANTELSAGGRTFTFRGGYDPEDPLAGIVHFTPEGSPVSGSLAKSARVSTAALSLDLVEGDRLDFSPDGKLASIRPVWMSRLGIGEKRAVAKVELQVQPDGSLAPSFLPESLWSLKGKISIAPLGALCTDSRVRLRSGPNLEAAVLGFLEKGDRVLILDTTPPSKIDGENGLDYWYKTRRQSDGLVGWSNGLYLRLDP